MTRSLCVFAIVLAVNGSAVEAPPVYPPNAALSYWRATSLLSSLSDDDRKLCGQGYNVPPSEKRMEIA